MTINWAEVKTGSIVRIAGADKPFHFLVFGVEPTRNGSHMAWLRGTKVTAAGKPVAQIDHLHLGEHLRQELADIANVTVVGAMEVSNSNGKPRRARKAA